MLKFLLFSGTLLGSLSVGALARGQALPTATARGDLQIGVGYSYASPDYGPSRIQGISGWADLDITSHIGIEAGIHYVAFITPTDLAEDSYVIGPRVVFNKGRFRPYFKGVIGLGNLVIQEVADNQGRGNGTYLMYGAGGGLDIVVTRHIIVRAIDFEYQGWPGLGNGLTPRVATAGIAYRFR